MCGIAGFAGLFDEQLLQAMNASLAHRGPDDANYFTSDEVSLAYRRLAIIDREGGNQPIFNEDRTKVIVYNGEIYNYRELRERLRGKHFFDTNSDTEVIIHLYEELGEAAFAQLNGMFAFAIYDAQARKLILARDRFGIKPLFYALQGEKLYFASEIKALLHCIRPVPNEEQIYDYLAYRLHDHNEETFFAGIRRLLPGAYLTYQGGKVTIERYWEPTFGRDGEKIDERELSERFERLFVKAVRSQLVGEVPIGSCLSGGLDSSSIVATINSLLKQAIPEKEVIGERQKTFSALFPGEVNDETAYIDRLTADVEVEKHSIYPRSGDLWPELERIVYHQDEPFVSTGIFAQWEVMKAASKEVTVLLDGQGADELMAGYTPYYFVYLRQLWKERRLPRLVKEFLLSLDILFFASFDQVKQRLRLAKAIDPQTLLDPKFVERSRTAPPSPCKDDLNKRLWEDISIYSLPSLLRYEDRNSMAFGLESRVPFLDNDLVDLILSLPPSMKIKNGWNKFILRGALRDYLPGKIRRRRWKVGFTTPEVAWLRAEKDKVLEVFTSPQFRSRGYVDAERVTEAFRWFVEGKTSNSLVFWRILNLELWFRVFFDGDSNERSGIRSAQPG
ncbi:MAG: asparagine synthase (glutamine-hydrolyzing) [Chloroflexi bacterium]|nr:asparagine synthase (glutamine-hydrolyzing) [Chloroflexota bacterium]